MKAFNYFVITTMLADDIYFTVRRYPIGTGFPDHDEEQFLMPNDGWSSSEKKASKFKTYKKAMSRLFDVAWIERKEAKR